MSVAPRREGASRRVVGIAEMAVSGDPGDELITYALGSCIGVCVWDPAVRVGGLLHVMLPSSSVDPERARVNPERFMDTGLPRLFHECYRLGARKDRMIVKAAGGATMGARGGLDGFRIGKRNFLMLRKVLWINGVLLEGYDVGGRASRTLSLDVGTGEVRVKTAGRAVPLGGRREEWEGEAPCP